MYSEEGSPISPMSGPSNIADQAWGVSDSEEDDEEDDQEQQEYAPPIQMTPKQRSVTRMSAIVNEEIANVGNVPKNSVNNNRRMESRFSALSLSKDTGSSHNSRVFDIELDKNSTALPTRDTHHVANHDANYTFAPKLEDYISPTDGQLKVKPTTLKPTVVIVKSIADNPDNVRDIKPAANIISLPLDTAASITTLPKSSTSTEANPELLEELLNQLEQEDEVTLPTPTPSTGRNNPSGGGGKESGVGMKPPLTINTGNPTHPPILPKPLLKKTDHGISILHSASTLSHSNLNPLSTNIATTPVMAHSTMVLTKLPDISEFASRMQVVHEGWLEKKTNYTGWKKVYGVLMESREQVCVLYLYERMIETSWGSIPIHLKSKIPITLIDSVETESHRYAKGREFIIRRKSPDSEVQSSPAGDITPGNADTQSVKSDSTKKSNKSNESKLSNWLFQKSATMLDKDLILRCDTAETRLIWTVLLMKVLDLIQ